MPQTPLTANDVRRLAEALDGYRGDPVRVVLRKGTLRWLPNGQRPMPGDRELFDVQTEDASPTRPKLKAIRLDPPVAHPVTGEPIDDVLDVFDSLFWTEPAVSKFVLPYYMRFYSPQDVHTLWMAFLGKRADGARDEGSEVLAFGHLPWSEPTIIEEGEDGEPAVEYDTMALLVAEAPRADGAAAEERTAGAGAPAARSAVAAPPATAGAYAPPAAARGAERRYRVLTARQFLAERAR